MSKSLITPNEQVFVLVVLAAAASINALALLAMP
jgi:hypothetical protein